MDTLLQNPLVNAGATGFFFVVVLWWLLRHVDKIMATNREFANLIANHMTAIKTHMELDVKTHEAVEKVMQNQTEAIKTLTDALLRLASK